MNEGRKISYTVTPNTPDKAPITIETNKEVEQLIEVLEEKNIESIQEQKVEEVEKSTEIFELR